MSRVVIWVSIAIRLIWFTQSSTDAAGLPTLQVATSAVSLGAYQYTATSAIVKLDPLSPECLRSRPCLQLLKEMHLWQRLVSQLFRTSWRHTDRQRPEVISVYRVVSGSIQTRYAKYWYAGFYSSWGSHCLIIQSTGLSAQKEEDFWHSTRRICNLGNDDNSIQICEQAYCALRRIISSGYRVDLAKSTGM